MKIRKVFFALLLFCVIPSNPTIGHAYTTSGSSSSSIAVFCSPPANLSRSGTYYAELVAEELRDDYPDVKIKIHFLKSSGIRAGGDDGSVSGGEHLDVSTGELGGIMLNGSIDFPPCKIIMPVSVSMTATGSNDQTIRVSTRSTITISGYLIPRRGTFGSGGYVYTDCNGIKYYTY